MKNWTMEKLDREAERIAKRRAPEALLYDSHGRYLPYACDPETVRTTLIAMHGHPTR